MNIVKMSFNDKGPYPIKTDRCSLIIVSSIFKGSGSIMSLLKRGGGYSCQLSCQLNDDSSIMKGHTFVTPVKFDWWLITPFVTCLSDRCQLLIDMCQLLIDSCHILIDSCHYMKSWRHWLVQDPHFYTTKVTKLGVGGDFTDGPMYS